MNTFKEPKFDHTMNRWYVEEIDNHTGRVVASYDFYDEMDARQFFYENSIRAEVLDDNVVYQ